MGTRLREVTGDEVPKVLVPVAGRPFIDWKLDELRRAGVDDAVLLVAHQGDEVAAHVGDGARLGLRVRCIADGDTLLGTGGAVQRALPLLPEAFWVTYGDSLLHVDLARAEAEFARSGIAGLMTVWHNRNRLGPSNALVHDGLVVAYSKAPPPAGAEHIDYGILLLTRSCFAGRAPDERFDLAEVLTPLASAGRLGAFEVHDRFHDIGDPVALGETERYLEGNGPA
jgi:NDP-sugar pyrophosphorylase family protein